MGLIVIAEDEVLMANMLVMFLEDAGHEAFAAPNGNSALTLLKDKNADLVITDYMMPQMTGLEFARAIRADHTIAHVPIILVSGAQASIGRAHPELFDVVLNKPYELEKLLVHVNELLGTKAQRSGKQVDQ